MRVSAAQEKQNQERVMIFTK